jgi:hypothetical protein
VRFVRYPLLRYRVLPVTIALFAALWLALPVLSAPATPPDTAPIQGTGTARQDPPGSCSGRPDTITFPATVQIQGRILHIIDPGGETSGTINADGTAQLTGPGESYALLSIQATTLSLREKNGGCNFLTTIVLQRVLYQVPTVAPSTQTSETASQPTVSGAPGGVIVPETSGGRSLSWLWGAGAVAGVGVLGGGLWFVFRQPVTSTDVATDCPKEREAVRRAFEEARPFVGAAADWEVLPPEADEKLAELDRALNALDQCLGRLGREQVISSPLDSDGRRYMLRRYGLLPEPAPFFAPVPPSEGSSADSGFDPVPPTAPPTEGTSEEGDERKEIG